jgi:large subunit ribosomal protein L11
MSKPTFGKVKMILPAGKATMGPPVGPSLGQVGIPAKQFCDTFNEKTKNMPAGSNVQVKVFFKNSGKAFDIVIKSESVSAKFKRMLNADKVVGLSITREQIETIAKEKIADGTASCLEKMCNTVTGTARASGLKIVD